jgi:hypothetical protein
MRRYLALFSVVSLALAGTASAYVQRGDTELDLLGGWSSESGGSAGFDADSLFVSASVGYFVDDNVEIGVGGLGSWVKLSGINTPFDTGQAGVTGAFQDADVKVNAYGIGGRIKWHFTPANPWVPYIGAQGYWTSATVDIDADTVIDSGGGPMLGASIIMDNDASGFLIGPIAGIRGEINEFNDFFVEAQYHMWTGDIGDIFDNGFGVFFGIIHQFQ